MGLLEEWWEKFALSAQAAGVSPNAAAAFAALVMVAVLLSYTSFFSSAALKVSVYSRDAPVAGASVELVSLEGKVLARGVTGESGVASFKQKVYSEKVSVRVSKPGLYSAEGTEQAALLVDLSKKKSVSFELYPALPAVEEFRGVSFSVLDKISLNPVQSVQVEATVGDSGNAFSPPADSQAKFFVNASRGQQIKLKISAPNYYSEERLFIADGPRENVLLSPKVSPQFSFSGGELGRIGQGSTLNSSDGVEEDGSPEIGRAHV